MFYSLLVPLDGTPQAAAALPLARSVAVASGGALTLLRVAFRHDQRAANTAESYLLPIAQELREAVSNVRVCVRHGEPAAEIVRQARDANHDLIVMSSHAHGSRSIAALASVSRRVLTASPAPVLMVRPEGVRTTRIRTLLVPVDGSPGASLALGVALAMTRASAARIVLLDVVVPLAAPAFGDLPGMTLGGFIDPAWEQLAQTSAHAYVEALAEYVARRGG
jgi:nucleotide-binding universal stress UspA family protein